MIATTGMGFKIHANTPKELKAKQFVLIKEKDFNDLSLNNDEKRLFLSIMKSNKIEIKKDYSNR